MHHILKRTFHLRPRRHTFGTRFIDRRSCNYNTGVLIDSIKRGAAVNLTDGAIVSAES